MVNTEMASNEMRAIDEVPTRGDFGVWGAKVIAPGDPWRSVLLHRLATTGSGHMPVIGAHEVDEHGLMNLMLWITTLPLGDEENTDPDGLEKIEAISHATLSSGEQPEESNSSWGKVLKFPESALFTALVGVRTLEPEKQRPGFLSLAKQSPNAHIRALFERFLPDDQRVETLGASASAEKILAVKGDAERGAELFSSTGKAAACLACHFVNGSGRNFGPDLSKVGARLNQAQLIESLLAPSKLIAPGYQPVVLTMKDGDAQSGFIVKREGEDVLLKIATGQSVPLKKAEIQSEQTLPVSLMPEGLLQSFTAQEAADLLAYLGSLK
jgi:putative heme-binding domain-containing protein